MTTVETAVRRRRRLNSELDKISEEWSLSDCSANAGRDKATARAPKASSAVAAAALHTMQQEAEWPLREWQATCWTRPSRPSGAVLPLEG